MILNKLNKDLKDIRIAKLCEDVHLMTNDKSQEQYIVYNVIDEKNTEYSSNQAINRRYIIQIDIFSDYDANKDYVELSNVVEEVFSEKGYVFQGAYSLFEDETRYFHRILRFNYTQIL